MSAAQTPDLTIPIALDYGKALAQLKRMQDKLAETGAEGEKAGRKASSALAGIGDAMLDLGRHQGWTIIKDLGMSMVDSFDQAAKHIREISGEFIKLQQLQTQIAALQGRANNDDFTVEQADLAMQASLTPQEWTKFQEEFQSFGGAFIEGPNAKLGEDDATKYQQYVAQFAKARGLAPSEAAQLAGGLLQFADGPTTAADMVAQFGKVFTTLERAPTPVPQLLPQMSRVMAQGVGALDASRMLAVMSEATPGEEETGVTNVLKALREARLDGKGAGLGIDKSQTQMEQVLAAAKTLDARQKGGEDLEELMQQYFPDIRQFRGMMGFLNRGLRGGSFERSKGYQDNTADDYVETQLGAWEQSDAGRRSKLAAEEEWRRIRNGADDAASLDAMQEAKNQLLAERRFENPEAGDAARGMFSWILGSKEDQLIRERAIQNAVQRARDAGSTLPDSLGVLPAAGIQDDHEGLTLLAALLKEIAANTAKGAAPKPLNAAPPAPKTRP